MRMWPYLLWLTLFPMSLPWRVFSALICKLSLPWRVSDWGTVHRGSTWFHVRCSLLFIRDFNPLTFSKFAHVRSYASSLTFSVYHVVSRFIYSFLSFVLWIKVSWFPFFFSGLAILCQSYRPDTSSKPRVCARMRRVPQPPLNRTLSTPGLLSRPASPPAPPRLSSFHLKIICDFNSTL